MKKNAEPKPRRLKHQQWLLVSAGVLGVGAAVARWAVNTRREQQRRPLQEADRRELAMIPLPSPPLQTIAAPQTTMAQTVAAPPAVIPAVPSAAPLPLTGVSPAALVPDAAQVSAPAILDAPPSPGLALRETPAPSLDGAVATRKRKTASAETAETPTPIPSAPVKTTRGASKSGAATGAPEASAAASTMLPETSTGKKKMSTTTGKRSKMSEEFDEALQENTVEGPGTRGGTAQSAVAAMGAGAASASPAPGVSAAAPAENALATQAEGKLAVGEELRDREFPVPPQDTGAVSQRLVVDQETLGDEGPRPGGVAGTMPGDRQANGDINDIVDQRSVTPDLEQQKG